MTKLAYIVDRNNFGKVRFYGLVSVKDGIGNIKTYTFVTFWKLFRNYTSYFYINCNILKPLFLYSYGKLT